MARVRLHYHDLEPNFGDDLNPWLWSRLLPGGFDPDAPDQLVAIGTLLNHRLPRARRTLVFGSGVGYGRVPAIDASWHWYCVRGPRSARALGLSPSLALTDPGVLVRRVVPPGSGGSGPAFMPHVAELRWRPGLWQDVCLGLGLRCIDARAGVDDVLAAISRSDVLYTQALHGAICADALRIPWVAVHPSRALAFKWQDWCESMELDYRPLEIRSGRRLLRQLGRLGPLGAVERGVLTRRLERAIAAGQPTLSRTSVLEARLSALSAALEELAADLSAGPPLRP